MTAGLAGFRCLPTDGVVCSVVVGGEEGLTEGDSETDMAGRELRADEMLVGGCGDGLARGRWVAR